MVGDSLTENGNWSAYFPDISVVNRGIGGDTIEGVLYRYEKTIAPVEYRKAFVMLGINDLINGTPQNEILKHYATLLTKIKHDRREIYVLSVLQVVDKTGSMTGLNRRVTALNRELKVLTASAGYQFVDLNSALSDIVGLREVYSNDGIHLNAIGYAAWATAIRGFIDGRQNRM